MRVGRYELLAPFASGGMATIHVGHLSGTGGFDKPVAIKVPNADAASDPQFRAMFLDEARIAARIASPYVVATLDVLEDGPNLYQVMEYVNGPSLSATLKALHARDERMPISIALAIIVDMLEGLHAAHEAVDTRGAPLAVVHRDVSPQNVLISDDGIAKLINFGIASASGKLHLTQPGDLKGKASYMAPEQVEARAIDRRVDVYAAGLVLYEVLVGARAFQGADFATTVVKHLLESAPDPRATRADVPAGLAAIVARATERKPHDRYATARAMADALVALPVQRATAREVGAWLIDVQREFFVARRELLERPRVATDDATTAHTRVARTPQAKLRSWRWVGASALLVLGLGASAFVAVSMQTRTPVHAVQPQPLVAVTPSPTMPSAEPSAAVVEPTAADRAYVTKPPNRTHTRPHPSASTTVAAQPCCAGDLRIRFGECFNNCP